EHPCGLRHRHHTDKTGFVGCKTFDEPGCLNRLNRIVLRQIPDQNIGIDTDHRRRRGEGAAAPAAAASVISSRVTGDLRDFTMPRSVETGSLGNRTTAPSGCTKNLMRSPGFKHK